jgi:DNA-binding MarR family transcriptional regulator
MSEKLTPAQLWSLRYIAHKPRGMAEIGENMRKRPGAKKPMGNYARDRQGLGMVGSLMLGRLEKLGLAIRTFDNDNHRGIATDKGLAALRRIVEGRE